MENITGTIFSYYFVCHRKLWYFAHDIQMEKENSDVQLGKLIDETSYTREKKSIMIDDTICIDFIESYRVLHEVKKSSAVEEAAIWQVKYYLYYLKQRGICDLTGMIDYPKIRKREKVLLTEQDERRIAFILEDILKIVQEEKPPEITRLKICKKCSYFELCYV